MLRKTLAALIIAGVTGPLAMDFSTEVATAAVYVPPALKAEVKTQPVRWVYVQKRHGPRYRHKRAGFGYYYGGYYYAHPWWTIAVPAITVGPTIIYRESFGPRYRVKRPGFVYYHHGYWYRKRWW